MIRTLPTAADLLGAETLLLTVLALLFTLWYPQVDRARSISDPTATTRLEDEGATRARLRAPLLSRAIPPPAGLTALTPLFAPTAWAPIAGNPRTMVPVPATHTVDAP